MQASVGPERWENFSFKRGDIRDLITCHAVCKGVDYVLHQAALGSVPRSIEDPLSTHAANNTGFLNMLVAARDAKVKRFVYAASSSTYGDHPGLPKVEDVIGKPLSPYAVTKLVNELYADVFGRCYGMESIGLRYFNIFGRRQDPQGAYAAVVPKWVASMIRNEPVYINGDGETSRDFCYIDNVIQANLLAATSQHADAANQVYNVAVGDRTTLESAVRGHSRAARTEVSPSRRLQAGLPRLPCRRRAPFAGRHFQGAYASGVRAHAPYRRRPGRGDGLVCTGSELTNPVVPADAPPHTTTRTGRQE